MASFLLPLPPSLSVSATAHGETPGVSYTSPPTYPISGAHHITLPTRGLLLSEPSWLVMILDMESHPPGDKSSEAGSESQPRPYPRSKLAFSAPEPGYAVERTEVSQSEGVGRSPFQPLSRLGVSERESLHGCKGRANIPLNCYEDDMRGGYPHLLGAD